MMTAIPLSRRVRTFLAGLLLVSGVSALRAELSPEIRAQIPPAATTPVDFARDIQPIFEASCVQCHARGKSKGLLSIETREDFLLGGDTGAAAVAGKSGESLVIEMVSGLDPEHVMPKKGKRLTTEQIALFRGWIDQGMQWPEEINFFKHEPANLHPRDPAGMKVAAGFPNPADGFVDAYFTANHLKWPSPVDDRTYARRVWLDAIGLLPPPEELAAFLADASPDKRARLVERLLSDRQAYAEHWLTFWNDMLRNDYKGTGYIDGGRKPISGWLYASLVDNLPYDRFVAQLIDPGAESEGFTNGIVWRGSVNASMLPPMQAAQGVSQVFLGVNLKCASCHDSFINEYTLQDSYGLAGVYADGPLEIAECDKPTGHFVKAKFLFEEIGAIDAASDRNERKRRLAEIITGRPDGRLSRTIVNRLWQRFMGRGLVEPVDEMDRPAWSPDLMDWLAEDLVAHGYDLKHTMARILTSRAYQLPAVNVGEAEEHFVFQGPAVRRLDAEQFADAVMALTGISYPAGQGRVNRAFAFGGTAALPLQPKWIWATPGAEIGARPAKAVFSRVLALDAAPTEAFLTIAADNNYEVLINGVKVAAASSHTSTTANRYDVSDKLRSGNNEITVTVTNVSPDGTVPGENAKGTQSIAAGAAAESPAGLILYARIRTAEKVADMVSDDSWRVAVDQREPAVAAVELGGVELAPWKLGSYFLQLAASSPDTRRVQRASLVAADPLMVALGRPNREQVTTVRLGMATTLQALELANGSTFAGMLEKGTERIMADAPSSAGALVDNLYFHALGRSPTPAEQAMAEQLVGAPVRSEGVQDFLWALTMLPEFQLID